MKKIHLILGLLLSACLMTVGCKSEPQPADPSSDPSKEPSSEPSSEPSAEPSDDPGTQTYQITELYPIGDALDCGWNILSTEAMTAKDGIFTWEGNVESGKEFKFLCQKEADKWWPGLIRDNTKDDPFAIIFEETGSKDVKFNVDKKGKYRFTINAKDIDALTLEVELLEEQPEDPIDIEELYILGSATATGWSLDDMEQLSTTGDGVFKWSGTLKAKDGSDDAKFRFPLQKESNVWWPCLVSGDEEGTVAIGKGGAADSKQFTVAEDGLYSITIDVNAMTIKIEKVESDYIVKPLFGFQATQEDPHGMTKDAHRTLAVSGDYLILSNALDVTKMPVYNRMTGAYLGDDIVNTSTITGLADNQKFWAIASDDEGHLVAITYVDTRSDSENGTVRGYVWKDGITQPPASVWWAGFYNWGAGAAYAFSNLKVRGDVTGDAVVASSASSGSAVFNTFTAGKLDATYLRRSMYEGSAWISSNVIPTKADAKTAEELEFISVSGNFRQYISINSASIFDISDSYWYMGGNQWQHCAIGGDYIDAGSHRVFGVLNGWYANSALTINPDAMAYYYQLVVSDIGRNPTASSLTDGLLFASRSSENNAFLSGMGYGPQGMISPHAYEGMVLGENAVAANIREIGDVTLAKTSEDKVQVYALVMNLGLIAYEITFTD